MKKGDHSKMKSKGARRRKKKSIEYQMKSCLTWEYADDFCDIDNWHESLQADDSDNNIVKAVHLKKEEDARDDSPDDDYISVGGNQYRMEQSCPNESPPKNPSLTEVGPVVKEGPIPTANFSADIVHDVSSDDQLQRASSYRGKIADKIIDEKFPPHGTPSFITIQDEDTGSSYKNMQSSSLHLNCRNVKAKEKLTTEPQSHSDERTFKCTQCPKAFKTKTHLKSHRRSHSGERPYECTQCPKAFLFNHHLKDHERTHSKEKQFECTECPKKFNHSRNLTAHLRTHSGERPFECTTCGKRFAKSSHLKIHQRIHTEERPYKCTQCPKMFTQSANLKTHQLIHSGVRAYKCQQCPKEFSRKPDLTRHLRLHFGIKPFECAHCQKTFADSRYRSRHILKYHADKDLTFHHLSWLSNRK